MISVQSNSRGTLVVYLRSPMGTNSTLLDRRMLDQSTESFDKWPFTTVHMWGEKAQGNWILEIRNNAKNTTYLSLNLILYGTRTEPQRRSLPENETPESRAHESHNESDTEKPKQTYTEANSLAAHKIFSNIQNDQRNTDDKIFANVSPGKSVFYNQHQQSFLDWKKLKDTDYHRSGIPGSSTQMQPKFLSSMEDSFYLIASNQKNYKENLVENNSQQQQQQQTGGSDYEEDYEDEYYPEYDVHSVRKEEGIKATDKALLKILSTTKQAAITLFNNALAGSFVKPVVGSIQGAQKHHLPFFSSVVDSRVVVSGVGKAAGDSRGLLLGSGLFCFVCFVVFL